jgi:endoglucanase
MRQQPQFKGLFFVEGTSGNGTPSPFDNSYGSFWGEYLQGAYETPVIAGGNRVVYSPHSYGPSVFMQSYFQDPNFPANMPNIWDQKFGWVPKRTGRAVVIGEWGGTNQGLDAQWQTAFASYLIARGIDAFYWTLNPGSSDTGGWVLDRPDRAVDEAKLARIKAAQPSPTQFAQSLFIGYCTGSATGTSSPVSTPASTPTKKPVANPSQVCHCFCNKACNAAKLCYRLCMCSTPGAIEGYPFQ